MHTHARLTMCIISSYVLEPSCSTAKLQLKEIRGNQKDSNAHAYAIDYFQKPRDWRIIEVRNSFRSIKGRAQFIPISRW